MKKWSKKLRLFAKTLVSGCALIFYSTLHAYSPDQTLKPSDAKPIELEGVGISEKLGDSIDRTLQFTDDQNNTVTLDQYFDNDKPVVFSIVYYGCPSLCNFHLNGLIEVLKKINLVPGKDYTLVALSMDHKESAELASEKKQSYVEALGKPEAMNGFHFLTGTEENIKKIADQVGFGFHWNEGNKQYAHASAAIIMTPEAKISRYLHGIEFDEKTFRLALLEGSQGKIGNIVDQLVLFCFQFDPNKSKYTLYAYNVMQIGAAFMVLLLLIILLPAWLRQRKLGTPA